MGGRLMQHGFFFDAGRCSGCHACTVACKNWHGLPPGPLKYLRVYEYETGSFPDVRLHFQWIPCYHCEDPACIDACPSKAMHKEDKYGAVLIDDGICDGCRICYDVCPYGAPVFESDEIGVSARKCDMCLDRLERNESPICVLACPTRALDFDPLDDLVARYGDMRDMHDLPSSETTRPSVIFKPPGKKKQLVPYDVERALELLMRRDPLSPVFGSPDEVRDIPNGTIGRNDLVVKHRTSDDLMRRTRNDEG